MVYSFQLDIRNSVINIHNISKFKGFQYISDAIMHRKNTKLNLLAAAIIFRADNALDCLQNSEKVRNDIKS